MRRAKEDFDYSFLSLHRVYLTSTFFYIDLNLTSTPICVSLGVFIYNKGEPSGVDPPCGAQQSLSEPLQLLRGVTEAKTGRG